MLKLFAGGVITDLTQKIILSVVAVHQFLQPSLTLAQTTDFFLSRCDLVPELHS